MNNRLKVGDIILVYNPLFKDGVEEYPVLKIEGNQAKTEFRIFNTKIYGKYVYEYGKRLSAIYNNTYVVKRKDANVSNR